MNNKGPILGIALATSVLSGAAVADTTTHSPEDLRRLAAEQWTTVQNICENGYVDANDNLDAYCAETCELVLNTIKKESIIISSL